MFLVLNSINSGLVEGHCDISFSHLAHFLCLLKLHLHAYDFTFKVHVGVVELLNLVLECLELVNLVNLGEFPLLVDLFNLLFDYLSMLLEVCTQVLLLNEILLPDGSTKLLVELQIKSLVIRD